MKRLLLATAAMCAAALTAAEANFNIPLWEAGKVPLATGTGPLDTPFLTVHLPPENKRNGSAVIIAPGGGNIMLMYNVEGVDAAERFQDWGTAAFVLTHRLNPRYNDAARILDARRAIQLVRARAKEWKIDPKRLMFGGFSAGSSLARLAAATAVAGNEHAADPIDRQSSRPDLLLMVYSGGRATPGENLAAFPPVFLLAAAGDRGAADGSARLFLDINKAGGIAELHLYQRGRHGFGAGSLSPEFGSWMDSLKHFLQMNGFFDGKNFYVTSREVSAAAPPAAQAAQPSKSVNDGYGDFVYVAAGAFKMGDNFNDGDVRERPVHTVELDAYYIGKLEVTNGDWKRFQNDPGYDDPKYWPGGRVVPRDQSPYWKQAQNHGGGTPDSDNYPVISVNWDAATAYCNWLSAKTGKKYRLPTEAEWEKAARGSDQRRFPWGNNIDLSYANFVGSQEMDTVRPVGFYDGSKRGDFQTHNGASPYGALDMAGNVMEWCQDWYQRDYYASSPRKNPKGPTEGAYRVLRGGSFFFERHDARSYARSAGWPSLLAWRMIGFRPVREP